MYAPNSQLGSCIHIYKYTEGERGVKTGKTNVFISVIMVAFISTDTICSSRPSARHIRSTIYLCRCVYTRDASVKCSTYFLLPFNGLFAIVRRSTLLLRKLTIFVFQLWFSLLSSGIFCLFRSVSLHFFEALVSFHGFSVFFILSPLAVSFLFLSFLLAFFFLFYLIYPFWCRTSSQCCSLEMWQKGIFGWRWWWWLKCAFSFRELSANTTQSFFFLFVRHFSRNQTSDQMQSRNVSKKKTESERRKEIKCVLCGKNGACAQANDSPPTDLCAMKRTTNENVTMLKLDLLNHCTNNIHTHTLTAIAKTTHTHIEKKCIWSKLLSYRKVELIG